jgi:acetolactate synthase regulatory subunit
MKIKKIVQKIFYDDDGNKIGVELSYKDFDNLMEQLEELHDIQTIRQLKLSKKLTKFIPFDEIKKKNIGKK